MSRLRRHWARCRRLNSTLDGYLSSYTWVLLCIFFLQGHHRAESFALGLPVDARPPSPKAPPGGIVVTILLEEKVEEVSEHLLAQRLMEEAAITHYDAALNACPSWWPPRGDASHQDRVRACAKVLLDEERALRRVEDARRRKDGVGV